MRSPPAGFALRRAAAPLTGRGIAKRKQLRRPDGAEIASSTRLKSTIVEAHLLKTATGLTPMLSRSLQVARAAAAGWQARLDSHDAPRCRPMEDRAGEGPERTAASKKPVGPSEWSSDDEASPSSFSLRARARLQRSPLTPGVRDETQGPSAGCAPPRTNGWGGSHAASRSAPPPPRRSPRF